MKTKIAITVVCVLLAVGHNVWPGLKLDLTTTILLVVSLLPWLAAVVRSGELPGGFKIELQDVKAATEKVTANKGVQVALAGISDIERGNAEFLREVGQSDPNLALVGLRIELERRLNRLASALGLQATRRSAGALLRELVSREAIDRETAAGLGDLIALGNQAAHGAEVSLNAASWALDAAPLVLEVLDGLVAAETSQPANTRMEPTRP